MRVANFRDRFKELIQIFAKAWTDDVFKERLLKSPEKVFKEFGIPIDEKLRINLHIDTPEHFHLNFPIKLDVEELGDEDLKMIVGGLSDAAGAGISTASGVAAGAAVAAAI